MRGINIDNLILERDIFERGYIEKRMGEGEFNSISKFELFIWDLEMFLQLQKHLGDSIILKGGSAVQFYIPVTSQRTSIDIDMICKATHNEFHEALSKIETALNIDGGYCKFRVHKPKNPKLGLDSLETYYAKIPSICNEKELYTSRGEQEVKVEIMFSDHAYPIKRMKQPELFAMETAHEFNILALEYLFADKLTTLGPTTIGITNDRADEQFKQIYDVIAMFTSNIGYIFSKKELVKEYYREAAVNECKIRNISYDREKLLQDMHHLISRIKSIESNNSMLKLANDFQSLYLRRSVNRDKAQWAIVGYQLELLVNLIFNDDARILRVNDIISLIEKLEFVGVRGPERGRMIKDTRSALESEFGSLSGLSTDIMKKRLDRIIWELVSVLSFDEVSSAIKAVIDI